jgi:hypothetical protein
MNARQNHWVANDDVGEPGARKRHANSARLFAALVITVFVGLLLISAWVEMEGAVVGSDSAGSTPSAAESAPQFEYFPGQYVNRATEVEKPVETF